MCTKFGTAGLYRRVGQVRDEYDREVRYLKTQSEPPAQSRAARGTKITSSPTPSPSSPSNATGEGWSLVDASTPSGYGNSTPLQARTAKIVRASRQRVWLYGVMIAADTPLPEIPTLDADDMDILQPLPHDGELVNDGGPFQGYRFCEVAESIMCEHYCKSVTGHVLGNESASPEIFRLAFYLYGRLRLVKAAAERMVSPTREEGEAKGKRASEPDDVHGLRKIVAPIQYDINDPNTVKPHECECMMVSTDESFALSAEDHTWHGHPQFRMYKDHAWQVLGRSDGERTFGPWSLFIKEFKKPDLQGHRWKD